MRVEVRDRSGDLIWAFWADGSGKGGLTSRSYSATDIQKQVVGILSDACVQACSELPDDGLREHVAALFSGFINEHANSATGDAANLIDDALRENEARAQTGLAAASALRRIKGIVHVRRQDEGIHVVVGMEGGNVDGAAVADALSRVGASAVTAVASPHAHKMCT
ncbi:hypothetical protein NX868_23600 [Burkholderia thailandensis]|uniref:hypothetical protein n=1 Tax=Burkholderia thailandensis TaxID=57975 RepID=UPI0012FDFB97|nr:hypothetical protein [Burkholderia thailandensis]MCS3394164.1 hypothetical protein [Burkholderia thailandensis]MCS6427432.1 hypothetical protein [Burkholderia thailandensis]MCS6455638.1 hypothetical protein [Burkholderia thailandensis]MCS6466597.1 hypothetical protein [Burkholderia thailandensis]MCS6485248.1 hypothetical protein [Burkholderia thailandensis]